MIKEMKQYFKKRNEFIPIERVNLNARMYTPTINRKKQGFLGSIMLADIILPATFGVGFLITNLIFKINPLYLYK